MKTTTIVSVGMMIIWWFMSLVTLLDRKLYDKARWTHYWCLGALVAFCIIALVFGGFVERGYAIFALVGMTAVEVVIRRRRRHLTT